MSPPTSDEITQTIIALSAAQVGVAPENVSPATHYVNDLNFDSLDVVEFAMEIEDAFDIKVPDDRLETLNIVGDVIDYVSTELQSVATPGS